MTAAELRHHELVEAAVAQVNRRAPARSLNVSARRDEEIGSPGPDQHVEAALEL